MTHPHVVVVVFFVLYQQLENHLLQPVIYSGTVKLNPLTAVLAILVAVEIAGVLGALLAIPAAAVIAIVARDMWDHRRAGPRPSRRWAKKGFQRRRECVSLRRASSVGHCA